MKKRHTYHASSLVSLSVASIFFGFSGSAAAQAINCLEPLIFGDLFSCASPGTVVITPSNSRSTTGCVSTGSLPFSRGRCVVTQGFPPKAIQISVTAPTFTMSSGANNMDVNGFNIVTNANGAVYLSSSPAVQVPIGGTLNVNASQAGGSYSGTVSVSVVYQ